MERMFRIHVAAEMSGVSEGLIRAWERRYGAVKPRRTPSGYRAYTEADIEVLRRLKKITEEGVSIAEAVKLLPKIKRELKLEEAEAPVLRRVPQAEQFKLWQQQLLEAAIQLDQGRIESLLDEAVSSLPPVVFFEEVVAPLLREVGERWHAGTLSIAEEHVVTQAARQRLIGLLSGAPRRARKHVVCACLPNEDHEIGLLGASLRFRHAGWRVTYLGARTPPEHLGRVVKRLEPDLIALSCINDEGPVQMKRTLEAVREALPDGARVAIGGNAMLQYVDLVRSFGWSVVRGLSDSERLTR